MKLVVSSEDMSATVMPAEQHGGFPHKHISVSYQLAKIQQERLWRVDLCIYGGRERGRDSGEVVFSLTLPSQRSWEVALAKGEGERNFIQTFQNLNLKVWAYIDLLTSPPPWGEKLLIHITTVHVVGGPEKTDSKAVIVKFSLIMLAWERKREKRPNSVCTSEEETQDGEVHKVMGSELRSPGLEFLPQLWKFTGAGGGIDKTTTWLFWPY